MSEKDLIAEIKKTLTKIANNDPSWKLVLGRETLSASDLVQRLDKDKKLRKFVLTHYVGLAVEMEVHAREKRFGEEK
ncbi:unnamed protein product [marine sediment metagenome]|uniref:Uncharacterized protein n=1 Tax=marine sediment metagenome TaxID=412755 RepID=X1T4L2_9ZZZZ